ncbi:hypothetical protein OPS25_12475 [Alteromonas ponticola]|uniref:Uncharacterized protein n=1 Tax=Alteromonas aquimaris TaxID=2998417 RepID=A0ABT3P968_9ALTE|nr:hypothetical protein [Alteromonas aquimaris]MCW8109316.1 hypothetical protein [Alteromonas aquimaris]
MPYDFGSATLGIKNPFKPEGRFRVITGAILIGAGIFPLMNVASALQQGSVLGYIYAVLGFILIADGSRHLGHGLLQLFRYFVGRSVPSSLAYNHAPSERDVAAQEKEKNALLYDQQDLFSMLMGRKNVTFAEPVGWMARLLHSISPNLTFLPYPIRHLAQEMGSLVINFVAGLVLFAVVWFVVSTGLAGKVAQQITLPVMALVLLIFFIITWRNTANRIHNEGNQSLHSTGGLSFGILLALSILVPMVTGFLFDRIFGTELETVVAIKENLLTFSVWSNLALLLGACVLVVVGITPNLYTRLKKVTPKTEVSEYRDNLQESIHPNEVFINVENIILTNRRYKEIPNRIYQNYDPKLKIEAADKGGFFGELIIETQPALAADSDQCYKNSFRYFTTLLAQLCVLTGFAFFAMFLLKLGAAIEYFQTQNNLNQMSQFAAGISIVNAAKFYFFGWLTFYLAGRILNRASHLFWGEMQFSSLLMFMKTEGTFTESKVSTGMSIHDSTRSENTVVRSSITPWIILSRISSSIFATSGRANLESPRFIMSMSRDDVELDKIVAELKAFLKGRESIASITSEADLRNASTIHQVNQQTRALENDSSSASEKLTTRDEERAAGYLRNNPDKSEENAERKNEQ